MRPRIARLALRMAALYGLVGALWILLSDRLLVALVSNPNTVNSLQAYKGWAFVGVSAVLVYVTLRGQVKRWEQETAARERSETALRQSQLRLAGIVDTAMSAIISTDAEQRIVLFNAAAEKMFGRSAREVEGQTVDQLIPERFRAAHGEHIRRFLQTGASVDQMGMARTLTGLRADGREFPIEASAISQIEIGEKRVFTVILRDTGRGIPADKLDAIFDKFYQLDNSETRLCGGLGLGLYIAKKFTVLLGRRITVESAISEGSTFTVTIPLYVSASRSESRAGAFSSRAFTRPGKAGAQFAP